MASPDGSHESVHGNEQIAAGGTAATLVHNTHYLIPDTMDERTHDLPDSSPDLSNEEMVLLRKKGALELPPKEVQDALLDSYFRWVHPAYVIFDRREHMQRMAEGRASLLLLQAIFFIGAIYVEEEVIRKHYANRHAAELMFFKRAKALYEAEDESDPIIIIQALFLISFWWGSPTERKDIGHWLGAAISLAQARGMHRS